MPLDDGGPPGRIARREEQKTHKRQLGARRRGVATIAAGARGMRSVDEGPHAPGHAPAGLRESGREAERVEAGAAGTAHTWIHGVAKATQRTAFASGNRWDGTKTNGAHTHG